MKTVKLIRFYDNDKQTLGLLTVVEDGKLIFHSKSLELAWRNNQQGISCIPSGIYECQYTRSNRFSKLKGTDFFTYEVLGVRAGIRIHAGNFFTSIQGCVLLGDALKDLNMDAELDTIHSGNTILAFEKLMDYKPFQLQIVNQL